MEHDPANIVSTGYDEVKDRYAGIEPADGGWPRLRWLRDLLAGLPDGAEVLDLGCATGVPASVEIARRHRVSGVDISARQVAEAEQNVPEGTFICADAAEVDFPRAHFDAVVSFYTFDHRVPS